MENKMGSLLADAKDKFQQIVENYMALLEIYLEPEVDCPSSSCECCVCGDIH